MPPNYETKVQYAKPKDGPPLSKIDKTFIQQVTGGFLFPRRAVDSTLLMPLSEIASVQAVPTEEKMQKCKQFLDYVSSQEGAVLTIQASDMILTIHRDASYLSEANARRQAGGNPSCQVVKAFHKIM